MLLRQKFDPVAMKSFLTLLTLSFFHYEFHLSPAKKPFINGNWFSNDESLISEVNARLQAQPIEFYSNYTVEIRPRV